MKIKREESMRIKRGVNAHKKRVRISKSQKSYCGSNNKIVHSATRQSTKISDDIEHVIVQQTQNLQKLLYDAAVKFTNPPTWGSHDAVKREIRSIIDVAVEDLYLMINMHDISEFYYEMAIRTIEKAMGQCPGEGDYCNIDFDDLEEIVKSEKRKYKNSLKTNTHISNQQPEK